MAEDPKTLPTMPPAELPADGTITYNPARTASTRDVRTLDEAPKNQPPSTHGSRRPIAGDDSAGSSPLEEGEAAFEFVRRIGRGGMGEVWEAIQVSLGRTVAVKRIRPDRSDGTDSYRRMVDFDFRAEAHISARLEHPNIVPVHDYGVDQDGRPLLAMKLVQGRPWNEILHADIGRMSEADFLAKHLPILIDMTQAVAFAHAHNVVHRDLKPGQVMVGEYGEVLLMDWGLALFVGEESARAHPALDASHLPSRSTASCPSGTPALMAPEQTHADATRIGTWTDVYLLGGTLYFLLTGTYPHQSENATQAFMRAARGEVEDPRSRKPERDIPEPLRALAMRALAPAPQDRIASAKAFLDELQDFVSGASRRREAVELLAVARIELETARGSYDALNECLTKVGRAASLWPDCPELPPIRERALSAYAEAALAAHDLRLARLQAERLERGPARESTLARVAAAEADAQREAATRRLAIAAVFVLMALVIGGGTIFSINLKASQEEALDARDRATAAQKEAEKQRDAANIANEAATTARRRAEGLVSFMLGDLNENLEAIGKTALLKPVAEEALNYYDTMDEKDMDAQSRNQQGRALAQVARIFNSMGETGTALKTTDRAVAILNTVTADDVFGTTSTAELALIHSIRGEVQRSLGRFPEAYAEFEEFRDLMKKAIARNDKFDPWQNQVAQALMRMGSIHVERGEILRAVDKFAEAAEICKALYDRTGSIDYLRSYSTALGKQSQALMWSDDERRALELGRASLEAIERVRQADPSDIQVVKELSIAIGDYGQALFQSGLLREAMEQYHRAIETGELVAQNDPLNLRWQREQMVVKSFLAETYQRLGRGEDAVALLRKNAAQMGRLSEIFPDNRDWLHDVMGVRFRLGDALYLEGHTEEALAEFDACIEINERLESISGATLKTRHERATLLDYRASLLSQLDRFEEAFDCFLEQRAIYEGLLDETPTSHATWARLRYVLDSIQSFHQDFDNIDALLETTEDYLSLLKREPERRAQEEDEDDGPPAAVREAIVWLRHGYGLQRKGRMDESAAAFYKAIELSEPHLTSSKQAMANIAVANASLGIAPYEVAMTIRELAIRPEFSRSIIWKWGVIREAAAKARIAIPGPVDTQTPVQ